MACFATPLCDPFYEFCRAQMRENLLSLSIATLYILKDNLSNSILSDTYTMKL